MTVGSSAALYADPGVVEVLVRGLDAFVHDAIYVSVSYRYTGNLDDFGYGNFLCAVGYRFD